MDNHLDHTFNVDKHTEEFSIPLRVRNRMCVAARAAARDVRARQRRKHIKLETNEDIEIDMSDNVFVLAPLWCCMLTVCSTKWPVLWVRIDPDFHWLRHLTLTQEAFMWVLQARVEKNVASQIEVRHR